MRALLLWMACGATLVAQNIEGTVYDRFTGAPLAGVQVSALTGGSNDRVVSPSDPAGRFLLTVPRQKNVYVALFRSGYIVKTLTISPDQPTSTTDTRIALTPQAVVSGRIEDEDGFPMQGVNVRALRLTPANDRNKLQLVQSVESDDLGRFRISGLPAGRFFIHFVPIRLMPVWDSRYSAEYYPGTLEAGGAKQIETKAGQEITDINLRVTRREGVSVSGHLVLPAGGKIPRASSVSLFAQGPGMKWSVADAQVNEDGTFLMRHIQAGSYTLQLISCCGATGDLVAIMPLTVGAVGISGLEMPCRVSQSFDLSGKVSVEGRAPASAQSIHLYASNGQDKEALSDADGAFVVKGVLPGFYRISVYTASPGVGLGLNAPMQLGDRELPHGEEVALDGPPGAPLLIRLTGMTGVLPFRLQEADGRPVAGGRVLLVGAAPRMESWINTNANGEARIAVAPGEYRIFAAADSDDSSLLDDPDFRSAHQGDFATAHVVAGKNAKLVLTLPAR